MQAYLLKMSTFDKADSSRLSIKCALNHFSACEPDLNFNPYEVSRFLIRCPLEIFYGILWRIKLFGLLAV